MYYADARKLIAELILRPHACGPDCVCWELRKVPAIDETLQRLGVPKYQTINEAVEDLVQNLQAEKVHTRCQDRLRVTAYADFWVLSVITIFRQLTALASALVAASSSSRAAPCVLGISPVAKGRTLPENISEL